MRSKTNESEKNNISRREVDSLLRVSYLRMDSILQMYTKDYPSKYIGLWNLASIMRFGYAHLHGEAYKNLSAALKQSYLGEVVGQEIKAYRRVSKGQIIPENVFTGTDLVQKVSLAERIKTKRLTLVSFWYSNCGPCIAKFPQLKMLHEKYKHSNFQILAISTDNVKDQENWLKRIDEYQLP